MTTPTPQDIARAQGIVCAKVTIDGMVELIATALAAERSRWQAKCERLREALRPFAEAEYFVEVGDHHFHSAREAFYAAQHLGRPIPEIEMVEIAAKALCSKWPKDPNGCAAICLDRIGNFPKEGCRHATIVHGDRVRAVLTATAVARPAPAAERK